MRKLIPLLLIILMLPVSTLAETVVVEGDAAKQLYKADKGKAQVLVQNNKQFILRAPDGKETPMPDTVTVKPGEHLYISNEEKIFIHNIYDISDSSWVLKKQTPSSIAAITFQTLGKHSIRCAIHPTMETVINVVP